VSDNQRPPDSVEWSTILLIAFRTTLPFLLFLALLVVLLVIARLMV
jgi:hypothetical protein